MFVFWVYGHSNSKIEQLLHFNIINIAQYFMVCAYILLVGLLLVVSKWWERIDADKQAKPPAATAVETA